ncbi:MAG TPA: hypothetical protein VFQ80_11690, partial [Thermomicrobiales bacterium]|nr:hypothetical protein [Thermomicrobiales bacterium]
AFSDATAQRLDLAVREMVETALQTAVGLNTRYRPQLDALVAALLEKETLDAKEVVAVFGSPGVPEDTEAGMTPQHEETRQESGALVAASGNEG